MNFRATVGISLLNRKVLKASTNTNKLTPISIPMATAKTLVTQQAVSVFETDSKQ